MALVPYNAAAAALGSHPVGAGLMNLNPKQKAALRKAAEIHALYNVPYMTKTGAVATVIRQAPPRRKGGPSATSVTRAPAAVGTSFTSPSPSIGRSGGRSATVRVSHTALFGSVTGTDTLSIQAFRVNPGISDLFPWLSGMAGVFDMYRIINMVVRFVPVTGTDTEGALYLAWDPDPLDPVPTSKSQLMAFQVSATGPVWKANQLRIPSLGARYIRRGEVIGAATNTYDNGQLFICNQSAPSQLLGDLYVDYTIELTLPHVYANNSPLYQPQWIKKASGTIAKATPVGTLPCASYGPPCIDSSSITYPSTGVLRCPVRNVVSYDNGSGSRTYRVLLYLYTVGTGITGIPTITCSDSGATITTQALCTTGTTVDASSVSITWTRPPLAGTYIDISYAAFTTVTATGIMFVQTPDGDSGTANQ